MSKAKRPAIRHYALPHDVIQPAEGTENHYDGWGPHIHSDEDKAGFATWKAELFGNDPRYAGEHEWARLGYTGGLMETLLWDLADAGIEFEYAVDQWAGVMTKGKVNGEEWTTWVEGDSILLALMETWRWWFKEMKVDRGGPTLA